ncbi:hypothetical protein BJ912DRAFT_972112 [Pholiota molesta]|nr:hypothetical protein BJ912DRAFT_972112 [Pholiota molesta]
MRTLRRLQHRAVQNLAAHAVSAVLQHSTRTALMSSSHHRIAFRASTVIWDAHAFRPRRILVCVIRLAPCLCATNSKNAVRIHLIRFPLSSSASHRAVRIAVIPRARTRPHPADPRLRRTAVSGLTQVRTPHTVTPARAHRLPRRRRRAAPGQSSISS